MLDYLEANHLLDSTIVILTGDHGEEFMEHGRWGHNSAFTEEQVRTPLVLWVPGMAHHTYSKITSHMDIAPTLITLLGGTNPPSDYCLGASLFAQRPEPYVILSDWNSIVYPRRRLQDHPAAEIHGRHPGRHHRRRPPHRRLPIDVHRQNPPPGRRPEKSRHLRPPLAHSPWGGWIVMHGARIARFILKLLGVANP